MTSIVQSNGPVYIGTFELYASSHGSSSHIEIVNKNNDREYASRSRNP